MNQSSEFGQNLDGGTDFWIFGQSFIKENCLDSRASNDIDIKLGPVNNLDKKNTAMSKNVDDDIILENCYAFFIFLIYCQFGAI